MINPRRRMTKIEYNDFSGGINLSQDGLTLRDNEVQYCKNFIMSKSGLFKRPGTLAKEITFPSKIHGTHKYFLTDDSEVCLVASDSKIYNVNHINSTKILVHTLSNASEVFFTDYSGVCYACNGVDFIKIENGTTSYRVGIAPPSAGVAAPAAGGSITDDTYSVYASFVRKGGSVYQLYSTPFYLGSVVCGGGNNTISISGVTLSSDPQVTHIVIWAKNSTELNHYYIGESPKATTTFTIASLANKNTAEIMEVESADNGLPGNFQQIKIAGNILWGVINNTMYYSNVGADDKFNLEIFGAEAYNIYKSKINGLFLIKDHLYLNTKRGIIKQTDADPSRVPIYLDSSLYIWDMKSAVEYSDNLICLTNSGIRMFSPENDRFLEYDLSEKIRPYIQEIYDHSDSAVAFLNYRSLTLRLDATSISRIEYVLSYSTGVDSGAFNNKKLIMNLDLLQLLPNKEYQLPVEYWSDGFNYSYECENVRYYFQNYSTFSVCYIEDSTVTTDTNIYLDDGTLPVVSADITSDVHLRIVSSELNARFRLFCGYITYRSNTLITIQPVIRESIAEIRSNIIGLTDTESAIYDVDKFDVGMFANESLIPLRFIISQEVAGNMLYLKITNTGNDPDLFINKFLLEGILNEHRLI